MHASNALSAFRKRNINNSNLNKTAEIGGNQEDNYLMHTPEQNARFNSNRMPSKGNYQTINTRTKSNQKTLEEDIMMHSTLTGFQSNAQARFKDSIKSKLQYEWKRIYRILTMSDTQATGSISPIIFEKAVLQCGVYITKEELARIIKLYRGTDDSSHINY